MTYRNILIAVDSMGRASEALLRGHQLAQTFGADYEVIHAVDPPAPLWPMLRPSDMQPVRERAKHHARQEVLKNFASACERAGMPDDLDERLEVVLGRPELAILNHLRATDPDLLIVGPHARASLLDFGHTVRGLLGHVETPVWIQPGGVQPIRRILAATDLSEHSRLAVEHAIELAQSLHAEVRMVYCYAAPTFAYGEPGEDLSGPSYTVDRDRELTRQEFERWAATFDWGDVPHEPRFLEGGAVSTLLEQAATCDLTVLGTHGRTGFSRFVLGSVAYAFSSRSPKPVVTVPDPDRAWRAEGAGEPVLASVPNHTCV